MKYRIKTHELCWYNCCYTVEADSEEEARELVEESEGDVYYDNYDTTVQVDIESVEEYEN